MRTKTSKQITKKPRIKTSSAKAKGRNLQQWVCQKISDLTGYEWGADLPISSRPMGQSGTDVRLESQVKALFPFSVECKCQESWSVHSWVEQAIKNQEKGMQWLLVCKRSRKKPVVIIDADVFFEILEKRREYNPDRLKDEVINYDYLNQDR